MHQRTVYSIDWNEQGILTGSGDNTIRLLVEDKETGWACMSQCEFSSDVNSGMFTNKHWGHFGNGKILVAWSKCGKRAAAGTDDGEVILLNITTS